MFMLALPILRQGDCYEFEVSLGYILSCRQVWGTDCDRVLTITKTVTNHKTKMCMCVCAINQLIVQAKYFSSFSFRWLLTHQDFEVFKPTTVERSGVLQRLEKSMYLSEELQSPDTLTSAEHRKSQNWMAESFSRKNRLPLWSLSLVCFLPLCELHRT